MGKEMAPGAGPADAPGIATDGKWKHHPGIAATVSPSVTFTGCGWRRHCAGDPGTREGGWAVVESFASVSRGVTRAGTSRRVHRLRDSTFFYAKQPS